MRINAQGPDVQIIEALYNMVKQHQYFLNQTTRIIHNYDPSTNIEVWLRVFEAKADRLGFDESTKTNQLSSYLPISMAQYILENSLLDTWEKNKKALVDAFGIPVDKQKQICQIKLKSLRQDNHSSRRFKIIFELVLMQLSEGVTLPKGLLLSIYLSTMNPCLKKEIGRISSYSTWKDIADQAIAIEEDNSRDDSS